MMVKRYVQRKIFIIYNLGACDRINGNDIFNLSNAILKQITNIHAS